MPCKHVRIGTYLYFDEFNDRHHELKAFDEFLRESHEVQNGRSQSDTIPHMLPKDRVVASKIYG
jgi:hypothetical protein